MKDQNCLNCKYEPDWSKWTMGEYPRCSGKCKYPVELPVLPKVYVIIIHDVLRYKDNSGMPQYCETWKAK